MARPAEPGERGWRGPVVRALLALTAAACFAAAAWCVAEPLAPWRTVLAVLLFGGLGLDAAQAAVRRRPPWFAKVGALP